MAKQTKKVHQSPEEELDMVRMYFKVQAVMAVKGYAKVTGQSHGEIPCLLCESGTMRFSIASNGHARVICNRVIRTVDGEDVHCISAME